MKFFYLPIENLFYVSPIPGEKDGISASCIGGQSIIINKYISEEKKIASGKIIDFLLSKESQKKYAKTKGKFSAMKEIYEDKELCQQIDCNLFKNLQLVSRPIHLWNNYDDYSLKFRTYLFDFLYKSESPKNTLQNIDNIASVSFIDHSSTTGMTILVINMIFILTILSSYGIIFLKRNEFYLKFYNKTSWFIMLLGLCLCLSSNFLLFGQMKEYKCISQLFLPITGMSMFIYPTLIYEIIHFPDPNKFSEFMKRNKLVMLIGLITLDMVYGVIIYVVSPFQLDLIYVEGGKNFKTCHSISNSYMILFIVFYIYKLTIAFSITILTFIEYNIIIIHNDMKTITILLYFNSIFIILLIGVNIFNPERFFFQYHFKMIIVWIVTLVNYIVVLWIRMYYEKSKQNSTYGVKIVKNSKKSVLTGINTSPGDSTTRKSIFSKIINYHYQHTNTFYESEDESNTSAIPEVQIYTSVIDSKQMTDIVGANQMIDTMDLDQ